MMSSKRWSVDVLGSWDRGNGQPVADVAVRDTSAERPRRVVVWWDGTVARCTECSGPLEAMLTSCPHARAVRRAAPAIPPVPFNEAGT